MHIQRLVLLLAFACAYSCYPPIEERVDYGPPPIPKIEYFGPEVAVYSDVEWPELIHTDLLRGFRPGMNFLDAVKAVGLPDKRGQGLWGPYYEYRRPGGRVELSFEEVGSGLTGATYTSWRLRAYPDSGDINELIDPVLRGRLSRDFQKRTELAIMKPKGAYPVLSIEIAEGRVESIDWLAE